MKTVSIVLLLAVIGSSLQQAVVTPSCSRTNSANMYALKWLENNKVTIFDSPKAFNNAAICNGDWNTHGTCCDVDTLKNYIKSQNDVIIGKWGKYISRMARVRGKLISGLKKMVSKLNVKDIKDRADSLNKHGAVYQKFKTSQYMLPENAEQVKYLKDWAETFEENIKTFKAQGATCFDLLKKSRASLLCSVCSGAAGTYTSPQSAAEIAVKITMDSCKAITSACFPIWKFNFGLTSLLQYVNIIKNAKKGDKADTKFKDELNMSQTQFADLKSTFSACTWNANTKTVSCEGQTNNGTNGTNATAVTPVITTDEHITKLCKIAFVINKDNAIVEGDADAVDDMDDNDTEDADKDAAKPISVTSRLLQTATTDPKVGVTIDNSGVSTATADSGLTPAGSVATSSAGDAPSSYAKIVSAGLVAAVAILSAL